MALADLVPWTRSRSVANQRSAAEGDPLAMFHREMNRMFDDFARGFAGLSPIGFGTGGTWPQVEVSETKDEVKVVAELPGMEQNDVEASLHDGMLTLRGEKKSETNGALYSERWHGHFQRSIQVGPDVDPDKVSASFNNGVLTVTLGKRPESESAVKRIPIGNG